MPNDGERFYDVVRQRRRPYVPEEVAALLQSVDRERTYSLADSLGQYVSTNLPKAIERRGELADYRTNPFVLLTGASLMDLSQPERFADFLFNTKLYMGLETSFGKAVEAAFVGHYPVEAPADGRWGDPPEKVREAATLSGLSREDKARARNKSVWREIDKSCVADGVRYVTTIKSGPNCINDTQVSGMVAAIATHHQAWLAQTGSEYGLERLDIVIGITYGTDRSTNNKENQILVKLLDAGFRELDRRAHPGVLVDEETGRVRVYRVIGQDFWSFIGYPPDPQAARYVFLEVLIGLTRALLNQVKGAGIEDRVNRKIQQLAAAVGRLRFPRGSLPVWVAAEFSEDALFWLQTAVSACYDDGI